MKIFLTCLQYYDCQWNQYVGVDESRAKDVKNLPDYDMHKAMNAADENAFFYLEVWENGTLIEKETYSIEKDGEWSSVYKK